MTGVIRDLWATKEPRTTVVVADSSFSEACKWKGIELDEEGPVFSLSPEQNVLDAITSEKAERVLFLLSSLSSETLASAKKIIIASQAPECCVLTSVAPWSVSMHRQSHDSTTQKSTQEDLSYEFIESLLFPAQTVVRYVPCHSIDLISGKDDTSLKFLILANHDARHINPLTMQALHGRISSASSRMSIEDIKAVDLPDKVRSELKSLAHEISSCLLMDLGLDPTHCIYALGKTSSLVGHSILSAAETGLKTLQTDRFTITSPPLQELFGAHSGFSDSPSPCSLVLIDRLEDIPTVLSALGPQSIAQRVLNTCRIAHDANPYRPSFDCKLDLSVQHPLFTSGSDNATSSLCQPRSALAGLPFKPPLSLCTSRALRPSVFVLPEDDGREKLISTLRGRIEGEGGTFVVKKRGVGAEMLALATALIESPGSEAERSRTWPQNLGFSPCVAVRRCSEISVALAYVEAMQRSAAKQFTGTYRAAYDVRAARESNMVQELFKTGPAGALTTLAHLYRSMDTHSQSSSALTGKGTTSGGPKSPTRKAPGKEAAKSEEDSGPVDLCHFLTLLASLIGLGRSQLADLSVAEAAAPILARLLRQASFEELRYLHCLGVPSAHFLEVLSADGGGESTGEEELWRGTLDLLQSLEGLQRHLSSRSSAVSSSNPHPLLDFMHDLDSGVPLVEPSTQRGLLARITRECLFLHSIDPQACALQHVATYIESPLKQMARAGLGLLSKGLGLFGGTPTASNNQLPHPAEQSVIVLCVVGGISSNEAVQVRQVLAQFNGTYGPAKQVILLSNALLSSDEALSRVFAATAASSTLSASAKES